MAKSSLDFSTMDQGRVSILTADPAAMTSLQEELTAKGMVVEIVTDPKKLYNEMSDGRKPGFVMISTLLTDPMAKILPDFVTKHFKVPVIMFREPGNIGPWTEAATLPPEIVPVANISPDALMATLKNFSAVYEKRLNNPTGGAISGTDFGEAIEAVPVEAAAPASESAAGTVPKNVMQALRESAQAKPVLIDLKDQVNLVTFRWLENGREDHFVFAFPDHGNSFEGAFGLIESCVKMVAGNEAILHHVSETVEGWFFDELQKRADESYTGVLGQSEIYILRFADRTSLALATTQPLEADLTLVPIESWWTTIPLPCPCYIWLGLNRRKILYIKAGRRFRPEAFTRLKNRGFNQMSVDTARVDFYQQVRQLVRAAIEKEKPKP